MPAGAARARYRLLGGKMSRSSAAVEIIGLEERNTIIVQKEQGGGANNYN